MPDRNKVSAIQADRDAVADFLRDVYGSPFALHHQIRQGLNDDHPLVGLVAAHRAAETERCAGIADAYSRGPVAQKVHGQTIATAIRSADHA